MKCPTCRNEMNDLSSFCVECGTLNPKIFPPEKNAEKEKPARIINDTSEAVNKTSSPIDNSASKSEPTLFESDEQNEKKQPFNAEIHEHRSTAHPQPQVNAPYPPTQQQKTISFISIFAFLISLVGLCMPMVTINIFGARHASGLDILKRAFETFDTPEVFMLFSFILTVVGLCFSLYSLKNRTAFSAILISSALAAIFLISTLSDWMDYIGTGFILFEIAQCVSIVLSIVVLCSSNRNENQ